MKDEQLIDVDEKENEQVRELLVKNNKYKLSWIPGSINDFIVISIIFISGCVSTNSLWFIPILLLGILLYYKVKIKIEVR